jgi:hypothetical protein
VSLDGGVGERTKRGRGRLGKEWRQLGGVAVTGRRRGGWEEWWRWLGGVVAAAGRSGDGGWEAQPVVRGERAASSG